MNIKEYKEGKLPKENLEEITIELMKKSLDKHYAAHWANLLEQEHSITRKSPQMKTVSRTWSWALPLAATILLCVGLFFYLHRTTTTIPFGTEQLLAEHLSERFPSEIGRGQVDISQFREAAREAYSKEDYPAASSNYELVGEGRTGEDTFFLGLSYLYNNNSAKAVEMLSDAHNRSAPTKKEYSQPIDWYLALAHLKNGDVAAAKPLLQQMIDGNYWIKKEAEELLKSLE